METILWIAGWVAKIKRRGRSAVEQLKINDFVIEIEKCDLKYTLFDLDQKRQQIQLVLSYSGLLVTDSYNEQRKIKKLLNKERTIYGHKIFCPSHQKTFWISDVDFGLLEEIETE